MVEYRALLQGNSLQVGDELLIYLTGHDAKQAVFSSHVNAFKNIVESLS
jgi:hypothetical protein